MSKVRPLTLSQLIQTLPPQTSNQTIAQLQRAYEFASEIHGGRHRDSGELYVEHDLAVAQIIAGLGVNDHTLVAALLHDSLLPHTGQSEEDLFRLFGPKVTALVAGFTNLQQYTGQNESKRKSNGDS